ncbi:MAG: DUF2645 family protein [Escherichia coli]|nr:DUF2645 family protein [Escherichia coli]
MSARMFVLCCIWFIVAFLWITITSATLPLFFPFLWFALWRKKRGWFMYATALAIFGYWLWQFFLRYQFCL